MAVEPWDPGYGAPVTGGGPTEPAGAVDVGRELPAGRWQPLTPTGAVAPAKSVVFVDGVRRVDARLWLTDPRGTHGGLAASYAAGTVHSDGTARVDGCVVRRGLFSPADAWTVPVAGADYVPVNVATDTPEDLMACVQARMRDLELGSTRIGGGADLVVIDGPLRGGGLPPHAVGYVKTHHARYLPPLVDDVVPRLRPGQRTPLFLTSGRFGRWSWYLRLPHGSGHPWAGIVRCEASDDLDSDTAAALADVTVVTLPRFASQPHKDGRAPQNLYPIAGLERHLRRMLGDPAFLYRQLRAALR